MRERKDSSPSPELMLAKTTPRNAEVHVSESSGEGQGCLKKACMDYSKVESQGDLFLCFTRKKNHI